MDIIKVSNLSKTYEYYKKQPGFFGSLRAFISREKLLAKAITEISFNIQEGELVGFLGPNGAGKTTTLKILSGILYPSSGRVRVLGFDPFKRESAYQKQFALVMGQKNQLLSDLPAWEIFVLNREIYGVCNQQFQSSLDELVESLQAKDFLDIPVRKLSLGQRMKCELIASLIHNPKVLFLDEPTIGLDVVAQKNIRDFLKKYNQNHKTTILLTSHYMEDIKELCRRVIIINLGKIIYDGSLESLIKKYATFKLLKLTFSKEVGISELKKYGQISTYTPVSATVLVPRLQAQAMAVKLLSSKKLPIEDILIDELGIDEIIRKIFTQG